MASVRDGDTDSDTDAHASMRDGDNQTKHANEQHEQTPHDDTVSDDPSSDDENSSDRMSATSSSEHSDTIRPHAWECSTCEPSPAVRVLIVFAGCPRVGTLEEAFEALGARVDTIDTLIGGRTHDCTSQEVRDRVLSSVRSGDYDFVWLGTPCSSFSVLWQEDGTGAPRTRQEPDGITPMPRKWQAYIDMHNTLVEFSAQVALAVHAKGGTFCIENPVDRGMPGSPHFKWAARGHAPLWLHSAMRKLAKATTPHWVSHTQCAFQGDFQKWTTLMAAGPKAARIRALKVMVCTSVHHGSLVPILVLSM